MTEGHPRPVEADPDDSATGSPAGPATRRRPVRVRPFGALHTVSSVQQRAIDDADRVITRFLRPSASGGPIGPAGDPWRGLADVATRLLAPVRPKTGDPGEVLALAAVAGRGAEGVAWLHNTDDVPRPGEQVRATAFSAHDGATIPADRVVVEPPTVDVPAGGSAATRVRVDTRGAAPGRYHGHLLIGDSALAVQVDVLA